MRVKLTAKHPRPASPSRTPVRPGSSSARKAARPAPAERPAPVAKPAAPRAGGKAEAPKRDGLNSTSAKAARARTSDARSNDAPRARTSDRRNEGPARGAPRPAATREARPPRERNLRDESERAARPTNRVRDGERPSGNTDRRANRGGQTEDRSRGARPARNDAAPGRPRQPAGQSAGERKTARPASGQRAAAGATAGKPPTTGLRVAKPVKAAAAGGQANPHVQASPRSDADDGLVRLSKRMSELGLCSRREADEWIENGWVRVDGERIDTLGTRIRPDQHIEVTRDAQAAQSRQVTILLHKPVGYVSGQAEEGYEPAIKLITAANRWEGDHAATRFMPSHLRALAPAGRLDIDSTGLLVLTQDGRIAKQLIGEHSSVEKEYLVRVKYGEHATNVAEHFPADKLALLRFGLSLDGVALKAAKVSWQNPEQLRFVLREGKKRQIRRMCELVGLYVVGLKRVRMGSVVLGALPQGKWRYLLPNEAF